DRSRHLRRWHGGPADCAYAQHGIDILRLINLTEVGRVDGCQLGEGALGRRGRRLAVPGSRKGDRRPDSSPAGTQPTPGNRRQVRILISLEQVPALFIQRRSGGETDVRLDAVRPCEREDSMCPLLRSGPEL